MKKFSSIPVKAQLASYKIANLLVNQKKSHLDAETIILPSLRIAVETMELGPDAVEKINKIPLSHKTMWCRIADISTYLDNQTKEHFAEADDIQMFWAMQIDERTDISGKAQLLAYVRFAKEQCIQNHFLFCDDLKETTTGADIFELVNKNVSSRGLRWKNCVSVCTDGAPSVQGLRNGFVAHVWSLNEHVKIVHCIIHREVLVSKSLTESLGVTMNQVIRIVNYIV